MDETRIEGRRYDISYHKYLKDQSVGTRTFNSICQYLTGLEQAKSQFIAPLESTERYLLMERVESIATSPNFLEELGKRYDNFNVSVEAPDWSLIRWIDDCEFVSDYITTNLRQQHHSSGQYIPYLALGYTSWSVTHMVVATTKLDANIKKTFARFKEKKSRPKVNAALSIDTIYDTSLPSIGNTIIIDATLFQGYRNLTPNRFKTIVNTNQGIFTPTGIFVGTFIEYIAFQDTNPPDMNGNTCEAEFEILGVST